MSSEQASRRIPIIASIAVSLMLTIAPLPEWADAYRPAWVALTLIYWSILLPSTCSVGSAWLTGLLLDVAQGTFFGQHALALCLIIYVSVKFHLQMRVFPVLQMTATVFAILVLYQFVLFWINGVAGIHAPSATYWGPLLTSTVFWPLLSMLYGRIHHRASAGY